MSDVPVFYRLRADPFRLTPDPSFCFRHGGYAQAREAMDAALATASPVTVVTGRPGIGKSTLVGEFLASLDSRRFVAARLMTTNLEADELLRMAAYGFKLNGDQDLTRVRENLQRLFDDLQRQHRRALLVVDEGHLLPRGALQTLGELADAGDGQRGALQVFLVGQPDLLTHLDAPELAALRQRIGSTTRLAPLKPDETRAYVEHRLRCAGWQGDPAVEPQAYGLIHRLSQGLPRDINKLCSRLLVYGMVEERHQLDSADVAWVAEELRDELLTPLSVLERAGMYAELRDTVEMNAPPTRAPEAPAAPAPGPPPSPGRPSMPPERESRGEGEPTRTVAARAAPPRPAGPGPGSWRPGPLARALMVLATLGLAAGWALAAYRVINGRLPGAHVPSAHVPGASPSRAEHLRKGATMKGEVRRPTPPNPPASTARPAPSPPAPSPALAAPPEAAPSPAPAPEPPSAAGGPDQAPATASATAPGVATPAPGPRASSRGDHGRPRPGTARREAPQAPPAPAPEPPGTGRSGPSARGPGDADADTASGRKPAPPIRRLLAEASSAYDEYRLTVPAGDSAADYYRRILARDPGNRAALAGLDQVVERYARMARTALARGNEERARTYIRRGRSIHPDDPQLRALQSRLTVPASDALSSDRPGKPASRDHASPDPAPSRSDAPLPPPSAPTIW